MPWEPLALLKAVRAVAALADPAAPRKVTQAAFDAARPSTGPYAGVPRAKRITEQLGLRRWSRVLAVAHEPEGKHAQLLGWKTKNEEQDWLTEEYVANVLKLVAGRRGGTTVTRAEYNEERVKLVAEDSKRWLHGRTVLVPTAAQIKNLLGSWSAALRVAELDETPQGSERRNPTRAANHEELLDRFWQHYETLPWKQDLQAFSRGNGIPYPGETRTTFGKERAAWIKRKRAEGIAVPDKPTLKSGEADYSRDIGAALPHERRRQRWNDLADCVAVVKLYLSQIPPGEAASADGYRAWTNQQNFATPAPNALTKHGGWSAVRKLAQEAP